MGPGYSAVQTARLVSALRWVCGRLSELVGVWASEAATAAAGDAQPGAGHPQTRTTGDSIHAGVTAAAVEMSVLSRRLASHRDVLDGLQPDSERLSSWRRAAPGDPSLADAIDEIAALHGPLERLAVARQVLIPQLLDACRDIGLHAATHCDGALVAAARSLSHDLSHDRIGGDSAPADPASSGAVAAEAAESRLSAAGGVVGRSLLRPTGWA